MNDILTTTATIDIEAAAGDKPPRVSITAYNGGRMNVAPFGEVIIDLAGLTAADSVTLLADHQNALAAVVGTGRPSTQGGKLTIEGTLTTATEAGRQLVGLARDGVKLQASVGVHIGERERVRAGEQIKANGQSVTAPAGGLLLVKAGELREVSITPVGADSRTTVTITAKGKTNMSTELNDNDILANERQRLVAIDRACSGNWGKDSAKVSTLRAKCVAGELELADLQGELLTILRASRPTGEGFIAGGDRPDEPGVLTASLCLSMGCKEQFVGEQFGERTVDAALSKSNRNVGFHAIMRSVLRAAGQPLPEGAFSASDIRRTFEADLQLRASGFSTISLPGILSDAQNKLLLESYKATPAAWKMFCSIGSNANFKTHSRYRLTGDSVYEKVGATGELKHTSLTEDTFTSQLDTYGRMIGVTRRDLINDDLSAFSQLGKILGRAGALAIEKALFTLILSNPGSPAFFSSDHANYSTAAGVLDIDSLTLAEQLFLKAVDAAGEPVGIQPRFLLVPPELSVTAILLTSALEIRDTYSQSTASATYPTANPHAKRFEVLTVPWLSHATLTGYSPTGFYLASDPATGVAMAEVAFLNGQESPTVETAQADFNTLGIQMRGFHDFGVSLEDYRAGVFFDGTT